MYDEQHIKMATKDVILALGDQFPWRWDEKHQALLSEFARDKKERSLSILQQHFSEKWDKKTIKTMPNSLRCQLGELTKLTKEQQLFARQATENSPAVIAIWWPWGHGGTISLRFTLLASNYTLSEEKSLGLFTKIRQLFN